MSAAVYYPTTDTRIEPAPRVAPEPRGRHMLRTSLITAAVTLNVAAAAVGFRWLQLATLDPTLPMGVPDSSYVATDTTRLAMLTPPDYSHAIYVGPAMTPHTPAVVPLSAQVPINDQVPPPEAYAVAPDTAPVTIPEDTRTEAADPVDTPTDVPAPATHETPNDPATAQ